MPSGHGALSAFGAASARVTPDNPRAKGVHWGAGRSTGLPPYPGPEAVMTGQPGERHTGGEAGHGLHAHSFHCPESHLVQLLIQGPRVLGVRPDACSAPPCCQAPGCGLALPGCHSAPQCLICRRVAVSAAGAPGRGMDGGGEQRPSWVGTWWDAASVGVQHTAHPKAAGWPAAHQLLSLAPGRAGE